MTAITDALTARQLGLLRRMSELEPSPFVFGGYAEDALLAGSVTRTHGDIDWLVPRNELALRLAQARALGFVDVETWGESAPGEPFYVVARNGDLTIDVGVTDEEGGRLLGRIWKIAFPVEGAEAPAGYQFELPGDTYTHAPARLEGIEVHVVSPLALYQIRAAIAARGSFGPLSASQRASLGKLRETFFPGRPGHELTPTIEPLVISPDG
jgi:hypothetical protein